MEKQIIEQHIARLIDLHRLPEDADIYLDSIGHQELQYRIHHHTVKNDLGSCAAIAARYEDSVAVLKKLDAATPTYLERRAKVGIASGSFQTLNGRDKNLKERKEDLNIADLDEKIEQCLHGITRRGAIRR